MTVIHITIESSFTGSSGGFQQIVIDDSLSIKELIRQYCASKGITVNASYAIINRSNMVLLPNKSLSYCGIKDNDSLVLGNITDDGRNYRFGHWFTLAGLGFLFGLVGMTICIILFAVIRTVPDNYAIVVDAGSTHSDVILYKWPGKKVNNTGEVEQVDTCYVTNGIAQISPNNISGYFEECFTKVKHQIPPESQSNAEVLLGATAGMRLLNSSAPAKAQATITSVQQYLRQTDLNVKESNVGIISGSSEGVSGWITINFLKDTIYSEVGHLNSSWGALDLGGASTQITFQVSEDYKNQSYVNTLHLFGHHFHVFSQSFLCYGVVQAMIRYRAVLLQEQLIQSNDPVINVTSPCEPLGRIVTLSELDFQTPCLKSSSSDIFSQLNGKTFNFVGSANYDLCKFHINRLLNLTFCRNSGWTNCMDPTPIPKDVSKRKFMGFASYAYVANALMINESTTKTVFEQKVESLCKFSYQKILEIKVNAKTKLKDLENSCFKAQLVYTFLNEMYGFNTNEKWSNIKFTTNVNGTTLGWSLGYMVNATEAISAGISVPTLRTVPFALLLVLFAMFLLISIGFVFHGIKLRKSASYQRETTIQMDEEIVKFIPVNTLKTTSTTPESQWRSKKAYSRVQVINN